MKIILNKIEFHYTYIVLSLFLVLSGYFNNLLLFTSLIIVHELGHVISMIIYGFNIDKIIIYPFGGIIKTNDIIDKDIDEELIVAISGLVSQTCFYILLSSFLDGKDLFILNSYHYAMLVLNILPIFPLDGYKIFNLILNKFLNYRLSGYISFVISFIFIIILLIVGFSNYSFYMIIVMLIYNNYNLCSNYNYLYNKFLLEKYLYVNKYKKLKIVNNIYNLYRNKLNYVNEEGILVREDKIIKKMFDYNGKIC